MAQEKFIIEIRTKGFAQSKKSLERVTKQTRSFAREANKGSSAASTFRRTMSQLRNNLLLVSFAFATVALTLKKFVDASSGFQTVKTRLVGLMGSVERAERAFNTFNKVASTTPFSLQDVVEAGAQLKAFGADAEKLIKPVTDLAAFMGTTATEAANSLGRAFAGGAGEADILRTKGVLNLVRSFKGIDNLSKLTLPEFRKALIETLVDPAVGIEGSTDRMSKTFMGAMSNMGDSVTRLAAEIGDSFLPSLTSLAGAIGRVANDLREFIVFAKNGRKNFNIFGESLRDFRLRIETLDLSDMRMEFKDLEAQLKTFDTSLQSLGQGDIVGMQIIPPETKGIFIETAGGMIKLSDAMVGVSGQFEHQGITILETSKLLKDFTQFADENLKTMMATNVGTETLTRKKNILAKEIKRLESIDKDLINIEKQFPDLYEDTTESQMTQIKATLDLVKTYKEQIGTKEEVIAVINMLEEAYKALDPATKAATKEAKAQAKTDKEAAKAAKERGNAAEEALKQRNKALEEWHKKSKTAIEEIAEANKTIFANSIEFQIQQIDLQADHFIAMKMDEVAVAQFAEQAKTDAVLKHLDERSAVYSAFEAGYNQFINTLTDAEMTGKERREKIWEASKNAFIKFTGDMILTWIRQQIARTVISKTGEAAAITSAAVTGTAIAAEYAIPASLAATASFGASAVTGEAAILASVIATKALASFAQGGDFVTSGPQVIMVGDNPGGRERVQISPLSSSAGASSGGVTINISGGVVDDDYIRNTLIPALNKATELGARINA